MIELKEYWTKRMLELEEESVSNIKPKLSLQKFFSSKILYVKLASILLWKKFLHKYAIFTYYMFVYSWDHLPRRFKLQPVLADVNNNWSNLLQTKHETRDVVEFNDKAKKEDDRILLNESARAVEMAEGVVGQGTVDKLKNMLNDVNDMSDDLKRKSNKKNLVS